MGGYFAIETFFRLNVNWTAAACLVSVTALIFTTYENRRRFKLDAINKTKSYNADLLTELTSQFIGNYQRILKYHFNCHRRYSRFNYQDYFIDETNKVIDKINDVTIDIDSTISQIEMLIVRIHGDPYNNELLSSIYDATEQLNDFNKNVDVSKIKSELEKRNSSEEVIDCVNKMIEKQLRISKRKIYIIQNNSIKIYDSLTN